ncbi:hypothetical protein PCASD_04687 [Puccinia coronata f. sp. avenae]|uniref:C3HC-type domain-containing protein n=1 Tax=Puccinia coronata f. sp. avenae TaxID=200324 RepID=A0A2N5SMB4_9BASI|nr:hypothetical protein PCASD_19393 [Puccinia coronata f. sp. avenae]PLW42925.1 hypothetical protein PCASD_04687 [Puccinia coronata f. sp. avenae]
MSTTTTTTTIPGSAGIDRARVQHALAILSQIDPTTPGPRTSTGSPTKLTGASTPGSSTIISTPALEALRRSRKNQGRKTKTGGTRAGGIQTREDSKRQPSRKEIRPSSQADFLARLESFKLSSYPAGKPRALSPPSMAAHGWTNVAKNRLKCMHCTATWVLPTPSNNRPWSSPSGTQLAALGIRMRTEQHRNTCPWRSRCCPPSIYRPPHFNTSQQTLEALVNTATEISHSGLFHSDNPMLQVQHTLSEQDITTLSIALQSSQLSSNPDSHLPSRSSPTIPALILALCGWSIKLVRSGRRESSQSITPANIPSDQESNNPPSNPPTCLAAEASLYCKLCHRQALPSPASMKPFNPIHEHRDYCPFIDPQAGFEAPRDNDHDHDLAAVAISRTPGWQAHLHAIQNVLSRQNLSHSSHQLVSTPGQPYVTLEHIATHFHSPLPAPLVPHQPRSASPNPLTSASPQINLLNFVKEVLSGCPSQRAAS